MKRYQECNIFVKLYRRLKYQPCYFIIAVFYCLKAKFIYKSKVSKLTFDLLCANWQIKANRIYTTEEVFDKLERSCKDGK